MRDYDFAATAPAVRYKLLVGSVVPRPIALVTTIDAAGNVNAAPYSFFNVLSHDPAVVALGIERRPDGRSKDTVRNIDLNGEFVVNLVDEAMGPGMNICAADVEPGIDELVLAGFDTAPSLKVRPPRIAQAPVALECRILQDVRLGADNKRAILLGEVLALRIREDLVDPANDRVDTARMALIGRLAASDYVRLTDRYAMPRVSAADLAKKK
ncbi:MAG: flavin reductase family protein [Rhodospirillales bacterium]|jgi:flavin reductase (DIM6/NTAB) family NADH-FMN oxidoreductase RutF